MELIKIENRDGKDTVNARDLHEKLESKRQFSNWIKAKIETLGFEQDIDYIKLNNFVNSDSKPKIEYHLSIDMAKHLAMTEGTDKGREVRKYFIECEKKLNGNTPALSQAELILQIAQQHVENEKRLNAMDERMSEIEAKQITISAEYYTVSGYCSLKNIKITPAKANAYGRKCAKYSREYDYEIGKVYDQKYGEVNSYHIDVLSENIP